jgi:nucleoredoxin
MTNVTLRLCLLFLACGAGPAWAADHVRLVLADGRTFTGDEVASDDASVSLRVSDKGIPVVMKFKREQIAEITVLAKPKAAGDDGDAAQADADAKPRRRGTFTVGWTDRAEAKSDDEAKEEPAEAKTEPEEPAAEPAADAQDDAADGKDDAGTTATADGASEGHAALIKSAARFLIDADGKRVDTSRLAQKRFVLLYFSASSSAPCQTFTPQLVQYYNANRKGDAFEVIFVSSDNDKASMAKHMKDAAMPWPAVAFLSIKASTLRKYLGNEIPCLVMLAPDGTVASDSFVGGKYVGPEQVLGELTKALQKP